MDKNFSNEFSSKINLNEKDVKENNHTEGDGDCFDQSDDESFSTPKSESGDVPNAEENVLDEASIKEKEQHLSASEKKERKEESLRLKNLGNTEFKNGKYLEAIDYYTDALKVCLLIHEGERAVLYSNRSAAYIQVNKNETALEDCEKAVSLNPSYIRARLRRAELYEKMDKLDDALEDYQKVLEQDPSQHAARAACMRLPDQIKIRNEKMKDEMLGKLKDLGNLVLRPFGLSTDNFKLQQDPNTGSYSVNFQQNSSRNV